MKKRSKIILIIVVVLIIIIAGLVSKLIFIDGFLDSSYGVNDYYTAYTNPPSELSPLIYEISDVDCDAPIDTENEEEFYVGDLATISQSDYCIAIEAIRNANPSQCAGMEEYQGQCEIIARWNDISSCQDDYTAGYAQGYCLRSAVMSAYSRDRQDPDIWQWCLEIEPYPKDSRYPDFNEQVYCLVGAAYHEQDKDICEQLSDKTDQKVCKKAVNQLMR